MTLTDWNAVSIVELIIYTPALLISILLWVRHGFRRDAAWFYLMSFTIIRLVGASLQLATIGSQSPIGLQLAIARLSYIGLSPLLLTTFGLLRRINHEINKTHRTGITPLHLRLIPIPVVIAIILVIVGVSISAGDLVETGSYTTQIATEVGVTLFIVAFAISVLITGILLLHRSHIEAGEQRLLIAVAASAPLVLVRLIYTVLATFTNVNGFSVINGSVVTMACAAVMEEMIVVMIYETVGLTLRQTPEQMPLRKKCKWWRSRSRVTTDMQPLSSEKMAVTRTIGREPVCDGSSRG
jgi:hypothetical protein